jgi:hypothetical protein
MPAIGVIRGEEGPTAGFTLPTPQTKRVLLALAQGLHAFPVSELPPGTGVAGNARVDEIVPAPRTSDPGGGAAGGGGTTWAWALLALLPAGLVLAMRRRGRWI